MPEVMKRAKQQKLCLMYVIDEKCIRRNQVAAFAATWLRRMQMRDLANARRNAEMILQDDEFARTTELISK